MKKFSENFINSISDVKDGIITKEVIIYFYQHVDKFLKQFKQNNLPEKEEDL
jgi:hypothetical protein